MTDGRMSWLVEGEGREKMFSDAESVPRNEECNATACKKGRVSISMQRASVRCTGTLYHTEYNQVQYIQATALYCCWYMCMLHIYCESFPPTIYDKLICMWSRTTWDKHSEENIANILFLVLAEPLPTARRQAATQYDVLSNYDTNNVFPFVCDKICCKGNLHQSAGIPRREQETRGLVDACVFVYVCKGSCGCTGNLTEKRCLLNRVACTACWLRR